MSNDGTIFSRPITEIIRDRISVRTYSNKAVTDDTVQKLDIFLKELTASQTAGLRLTSIAASTGMQGGASRLGTYGMIRGASRFIAAVVEKSSNDLERLGYLFEKAVLYATSMGLSTCWLGGSFNKGDFSKALSIKENEEIPIVSPVGYAKEGRDIVGSLVRFSAGSANRKAWDEIFFSGSFEGKLSRRDAGDYGEALEMMRLAPSASNKQPWRVVESDGKYHFYLRHTKGYGKMLGYDVQRIDMGIAMCHFEMTASEMGLKGRWSRENPNISGVPQDTDYIISWVI
ncbi:putative nitroreductase [Anaerobacterium chartisolvens]|uniref:Putative nitroreductase n=1 Tax=Anaerobacterium chartisolvens TaxID=1297424 RepID=A0A369BBB9_9FIRM|nr:nitroreductase family protein [Anaerobacterium chartisolvens]RCX18823.1 putative nitroreductase [Anaerobacterium chartisolvens]